MTRKFLFACTFLCMGSVASAQTVNSATTSGAEQGQNQAATSSVLVEGSVSSVASAPSNNNTGPCTIGNSLSVATGGIGLALGRGTLDVECNLRAEAHMLAQMVNVSAAVEHLCRHDETIRETLTARGVCKTTRPAARVQKSRTRMEPEVAPQRVSFTSCRRENGQIRVGVRKGASDAEKRKAVRECKARL